jgi:hypothetical protein
MVQATFILTVIERQIGLAPRPAHDATSGDLSTTVAVAQVA